MRASNAIYEVVDPNANILIGAVVHPRPQPEVKLTLIATGLADADVLPSRASREPGSRQPFFPRERRDPDAGREYGGRDRDYDDRERDYDDRDADLGGRRGPVPGEGDDDLDLPAFLRRRRLR